MLVLKYNCQGTDVEIISCKTNSVLDAFPAQAPQGKQNGYPGHLTFCIYSCSGKRLNILMLSATYTERKQKKTAVKDLLPVWCLQGSPHK